MAFELPEVTLARAPRIPNRPLIMTVDREKLFDKALAGQLGNTGLRTAANIWADIIQVQPGDAPAWNNFAIAMCSQAQHHVALMAHKRALELFIQLGHEAAAQSHSGYCMTSCYSDEFTPEQSAALHLMADDFVREKVRDWPNDRTPDRKLRLGLCSWDFREHSVMFFTLPWLRELDRQKFDIYTYYDAPKEDFVTEEIESLSMVFRRVTHWETQYWYRQILDDQIDILVDLSGHTARRQLDLFAWRGAPVQVNYVGYPHTSGIAAMDYRIVDAITDPGGYEQYASECLVRLPRNFLAYTPSHHALAECPMPKTDRPFTFGSFNAYNKITDEMLLIWAQILKAVPKSRLLMKTHSFKDPDTLELAKDRLREAGIPLNRTRLLARTLEKVDHFHLYGEMDLLLDPYPYNGTTTTAEALYHGVPVLTMLGDRHSARVSASILTAVGHPEWIAEDREDYIAQAVAIGRGEVVPVRGEALRFDVKDSMLMDGVGMARVLEDVFQEMWQRYCRA